MEDICPECISNLKLSEEMINVDIKKCGKIEESLQVTNKIIIF